MRKTHRWGVTSPRVGALRIPPTMTEETAFVLHDAFTREFTSALKERRCRHSRRFEHDIRRTVDVLSPLGGAWKLELVFWLYMHGPQRFMELRRGLGSVSSRVLTDKLRELAEQGLVEHVEADSVSNYGLTRRGEVVARHLHPLVFFLQNEAALSPALRAS